MRWTLAAALAGTILLAGCKDNEARQQIQELKDENAKLRDSKPDPLTQLLAAQMAGGGEGTDRKITALGEDLRAGIDQVKREIAASGAEQKRRVDELDERMRKLANLDATISALKTTIDALDARVKAGSPEEVLKLNREVIQKESDLAREKSAREAAEGQAAQLQADLKAALEAAQDLRDQLAALDEKDISKHPAYVKLQKDVRDLKTLIENKDSDIRTLDEQKQRLEEEVRRLKGESNVETPRIDPKAYDFTGTVTDYKPGARPGAPGSMLVNVDTGQVPAVNSVITIMNARAEPICTATVSVHYHIDDDPRKAVESLGCSVSDEKSLRVPTSGDTVVWVKPAEEKTGPTAGGN